MVRLEPQSRRNSHKLHVWALFRVPCAPSLVVNSGMLAVQGLERTDPVSLCKSKMVCGQIRASKSTKFAQIACLALFRVRCALFLVMKLGMLAVQRLERTDPVSLCKSEMVCGLEPTRSTVLSPSLRVLIRDALPSRTHVGEDKGVHKQRTFCRQIRLG